MTYQELKEELEKLTEEQLAESVLVDVESEGIIVPVSALGVFQTNRGWKLILSEFGG